MYERVEIEILKYIHIIVVGRSKIQAPLEIELWKLVGFDDIIVLTLTEGLSKPNPPPCRGSGCDTTPVLAAGPVG